MSINLPRPLFIVEVGPCPGAYFSKESYGEHLKRLGIKDSLDTTEREMEVLVPNCSPSSPEDSPEDEGTSDVR